ncbi:matrixin family metalloprotease [Paenibacillus polymyxa]|nr:matrixin family metalloprotease [Paenibacillus polymyxa]RTZ32599.1 matrixin family metalloprotease [Paenibacillus polymyxa]
MHGPMILLTRSPIQSSSCFQNLSAQSNNVSCYSSQKAQSVAAHELGHVLGLDEGFSKCLMYPTTPQRYDNWGIYTPQPSEDVFGINDLY